MSYSYILGSSPALLNIDPATRQRLDCEPWVFVMNEYAPHWTYTMIRPTVWVWGDLDTQYQASLCADYLRYISKAELLLQRLRLIIAWNGPCSDVPRVTASVLGIPILFYERGWHTDRDQIPVRDLGPDAHPIYHYGSSITDVANLAWILNPNFPIKLFGNEWGSDAHFYAPHDDPNPLPPDCKPRAWQGLADLWGRHGLPLVDCNQHLEPLPQEFAIPRGEL